MRQIVGVVKDVKERPEEKEGQPHVFVPIAQDAWWTATMVVQPTAGSAEALTSGVRAAIARVDRDQAVTEVQTLTMVGDKATARPRFRTVLIGTFALLALTLATVGVFGVLAYSVQQRTREFGVRIALGATTRNLLGIVVGSAVPVIAIGTVIGLSVAAVLGRTISSFLFGVRPIDPVTFVLVGVVLVITAAAATAAPAWRATRVNPVDAFRAE
jgi:putative ABC transport system permease protein